jgi:multiple sugar transport system substrate-binding protein
MIALNGASNLRSALGGTGLAVSANCKHVDVAMQYAAYVASPKCQSGLYTDNGGQPGHLLAWTNEENDRKTHNYFSNTLPALQRAYLRPRYFGHMFFQDHAGDIVRDYLINGGSETNVLAALNDLYVESKKKIQA